MVSRRTLVSLLRSFCGFAASVLLCASFAHSQPASAPRESRQPVLVELFTSEGCSDCPPADALLAQLDSTQPIPGAEAIVLSEHVTYWNHDGWRDPFSFDDIDLRQQQYARQFSIADVYTPQIVVDGAEQFVGNNGGRLASAITHAATTPKAELHIVNAQLEPNGSVDFAVHAGTGAKGSLIAALAANATVSEVARGENAGRTLHHVAVVRAIKEFGGKAVDGRSLHLSNAQPSGNSTGPLRLVVFLVNGWNGHVTAAAEETLNAPAPAVPAQASK
jgi:hypothetical protein